MGPYVVIVGDCAGPVGVWSFRTFTDAKRYREVTLRSFPERRAFVVNTDRVDHDGERAIDGLTDEERDLL